MNVLFMFTFLTVNENSDIFVHINLYENLTSLNVIPRNVSIILTIISFWKSLTLFRMGGTKSFPPLTPVTSINVEISPQNFLTFSFNPFTTMVQSFKTIPSASTKLLNLNQGHPQKS